MTGDIVTLLPVSWEAPLNWRVLAQKQLANVAIAFLTAICNLTDF